jgi:exo-beta-1,3-glucanase (GH17 family)
MRYFLFVATLVCIMTACSSESGVPHSPVKVEIVETADGFQLLRAGKPYVIKGAGMVVDDIERFAANGGNSIRNWTTVSDRQDTQALLDAAHEHGVTVALGLSVKPERRGFDYDDPEAVAAQLESLRGEVLKYRDHPALLFWIIGNELNHSYTNPRVYDAVNDIAEMIHELDPHHPVTTTTSGFKPEVNAEILARAPMLDFISFQMYGSLFDLPSRIEASGFNKPFMMTEWGTIGYWEMETTDWGIPFEMTSSEKADIFLRAHTEILAPLEGQLIGSYVFFWGQKQERTPTWFGLLTEAGRETEVVDVMQHIWTGEWPASRTPRVAAMRLDGKGDRKSVVLAAGETYAAELDAVDPEESLLSYWWELKRESGATSEGGDHEAPIPNMEGYLAQDGSQAMLTAPPPGDYRLFAYAVDDQGQVAHANIPFRVEGEFRQPADALLNGEVMAVAYSGFREGQHPDRGNGAVNPSDAEVLEDLQILVAHDLRLVRMYDAGENTEATLRLIRDNELPIKVLLGIWLKAEFSNHLGCPWLDKPIPDDELAANTSWNAQEIQRGIRLAKDYDDIVVAVNVGNEALVDWNDHMVPLDRVIAYVRQVKAAIDQPVTVADNYEWWKRDGAPLAAELDFIGVHTYPVWEDKSIEEAMAYTIENVQGVRAAIPDKPIAVLEAGWATSATEFGERANEADQAHYFADMKAWAAATNTTVFFFEAFDEPWKGDWKDPLGAEKHWGLFFVDRTPKLVFQSSPDVVDD